MSSAITALSPSVTNQNAFLFDPWASDNSTVSQNGNRNEALTPQAGQSSARLSAEYYSSDQLAITYTNKDGDSVSLNMQHIEYQKAQLDVQSNGQSDQQDWQKIVDGIKDEFLRMKKDMIAQFMESITGKKDDEDKTQTAPKVDANGNAAQTDTTDEIKGLPEYWNAENTSQRIVDFATSFLSMFQGKGEDFLNMIKGAIEDGFSQAHDMLGDLPDPITKLVNNTHDLTMKKLDDWAAANGIGAEQTDPAAEQSLAA
jgi:hypothetical protein